MSIGGQQNDGREAGNQREIEQSIDDALAQLAKAEPRPGLDARVLARLRGAQEEPTSKLRWWWVAPAFGAAVAMVLVFLWIARTNPQSVPAAPVAKAPAAPAVAADAKANHSDVALTNTARSNVLTVESGNEVSSRKARGVSGESNPDHSTIIASADRHTAEPMLEHFPSRRILSKRESLLVRYLNERSSTKQTSRKALLEATATGAQVDLKIDSLEIPPLQIADIEVSRDRTIGDRTDRDQTNQARTNQARTNEDQNEDQNQDQTNQDPTN